MTEDKITPRKKVSALIKRFNLFYLIKERQGTLQATSLVNHQWQPVKLADIPTSSTLARIILLIPNRETVFRQQKFSTDLVTAKNLQEAIDLNIESWSPYSAGCPQLSITTKKNGQWIIATWLWQQTTQDRLVNLLPAQQQTHIMPELAWHCARVTGNQPTLLITQTGQQLTYVYLNEDSLPTYIAQPKNTAEAVRFWRGLSSNTHKINNLTLSDQNITSTLLGLPTKLEKVFLKKPVARTRWLKKAQCESVNNWATPRHWLPLLLLLLSLVVIWAVTDALLINQKNRQIAELMHKSKQNYQKVIKQQEKIEKNLSTLTHYADLKQQQQQVEKILAELSTRIPNDIWLDAIQLEGDWLDITGQGKDVIRLLALLETLQNAKDIVLLNDVRTHARTGNERFQIRLVLR